MTQAVLFDLDDTLFDHHRSAGAALLRVHERFASSSTFEDFERHHSRYLEEMHIEVLAGRVEMNEARRERFRRVFRALGLTLAEDQIDAVASAYRSGYLTARRATDGAQALLTALHPRARIGIVSNNLLEEQTEKLQHCGLAPFVDALVVSEEAGISKPDPGIFHLALDSARGARGRSRDGRRLVGGRRRRRTSRRDPRHLVQPAAAAEARSGPGTSTRSLL